MGVGVGGGLDAENGTGTAGRGPHVRSGLGTENGPRAGSERDVRSRPDVLDVGDRCGCFGRWMVI